MKKILSLGFVLASLSFIGQVSGAVKIAGNEAGKSVKPPPPLTAADNQSPSQWCKENPAICRPRGPSDRRANTAQEHCYDLKGNNDDFVSPWEIETFAGQCP